MLVTASDPITEGGQASRPRRTLQSQGQTVSRGGEGLCGPPLVGSSGAWGWLMRHQRARAKADLASLDAKTIYKVVRSLFRRRNDYSQATLDELPSELGRFGILTVKDLRLLMKRHRRTLLKDEKIRMSRAETLWLTHEADSAGLDAFAGKSWYAVPGLVRQAMELEFGEEAVVYVLDL